MIPIRWEYRYLGGIGDGYTTDPEWEVKDLLNERGSEGWEVVNMFHPEHVGEDSILPKILLKRPYKLCPRKGCNGKTVFGSNFEPFRDTCGHCNIWSWKDERVL